LKPGSASRRRTISTTKSGALAGGMAGPGLRCGLVGDGLGPSAAAAPRRSSAARCHMYPRGRLSDKAGDRPPGGPSGRGSRHRGPGLRCPSGPRARGLQRVAPQTPRLRARAGAPRCVGQGTATVVEHGRCITGYATAVGFFGYAVTLREADAMYPVTRFGTRSPCALVATVRPIDVVVRASTTCRRKRNAVSGSAKRERRRRCGGAAGACDRPRIGTGRLVLLSDLQS
jgi:hypothetical protein